LLQKLIKLTVSARYDLVGADQDKGACKEPSIEYVARKSLHVPFPKPWLGEADDVQVYLAALRKVLLEAIEEGKRVQV